MMPSSPHLADSVVRAAAWDDGGAEFVFADGTILSFVDHMNTFVAVRTTPSLLHEKRAETQATRQEKQQRKRQLLSSPLAALGDYVDSVDDLTDEGETNRELCFTAWTLSKDTDKVRAALNIFNSLSERPRLLTPLLTPETPIQPIMSSSVIQSASVKNESDLITKSCGIWQEPGPPIETLLLERRADLFQRHVVVGTVNNWISPPSESAPEQSAPPATTLNSLSPSRLSTNGTSRHTERIDDPSVSQPGDCPIGTVLELWCALHRVCMRVAAHRETFTVRWPAPVTRPDGSRIPPFFHPRDTSLSSLPGWSSGVSHLGSASAPLLFTYVEQTFPVRDPPEAWRVMLQLALELEAEALEADRRLDTHTPVTGSAFSLTTWQGCLPQPHHWSGTLNHNRNCNSCRFSALTPSQATHLVAPRTARAVAAMRALHPPGALLRWMYQANYCGVDRTHVPAVFWCLRGATVSTCNGENDSNTSILADTPTAPSPQGTEVVAWVAEDGSVLRTKLEWQGYTITHHRLTSSLPGAAPPTPTMYRLQAHDTASAVTTADKRLPPRIAPLRCHVRIPPQAKPTGVQNGGREISSCSAISSDTKSPSYSNTNAKPSPHTSGRSDDITATVSATPTTAGKEWWAIAAIDPESLRCVSVSSRDTPRQSHTLSPVQPSCPCSALATLAATLPSGEKHRSNNIDLNRDSAAGALSLPCTRADMSTCGWTPLETPHTARRFRRGYYLSSVVDVAVQLSQVNCTTRRASGAAGPSTEHLRLAAYCHREPSTVLSPLLPFSACNSPRDKGIHPAAEIGAPSSVGAASVVHLTTRLDGIGTFTALTNGTVRVHFDDRTLLTLIPGLNELDEAQLLVTCVLRNATQCTMRATQCHSGHAIHRYLAYALPFRRYVYWRSVHPSESPAAVHDISAGKSTDGEQETELREQLLQRQTHGGESALGDRKKHIIAEEEAPTSRIKLQAIEPSLRDEVECLLTSSPSCSLATSFSPPDASESVTTMSEKAARASGANSALPHSDLSNACPRSPRVRLPFSNGKELQTNLHDTDPVWGLADTRRTLQAYDDSERAEASERCARLQELLDRNEALSHSTRALLRN